VATIDKQRNAAEREAMALYDACRLCPRQCGVNRNAGERGVCGETSDCRIASFTAHFGEEPALSGHLGSGTIFFSGCSCGCFFCQNYQISQEHLGRTLNHEELYNEARRLIARGVHNLNFVTPEHWWPHISVLCRRLRAEGESLPFVWNSSGYFLTEWLDRQCQLFDIFLPDYKFADPALAEACMGDSRYPDLALAGICRLAERVGFLRPWDESGDICAGRGLMVRHLVLPGQVENSLRVLDKLAREIGPQLPISLMSQFRPVPECFRRGALDRMVALDEYRQVCRHLDDLGFNRAFIQPEFGDDSFLPDFTDERPFKGNPPSTGPAAP
jgi:putative pyruvate formate lyase activating enzyme